MENSILKNNIKKTVTWQVFWALVIGVLIGLVTSLLNPVNRLFILGTIVLVTVILFSFANFKEFLLLIIIAKPVIDLTWNIKFVDLPSIGGSSGLNIQSIIATFLPFLLIFHIPKVDKHLLNSSVTKWLILFCGLSFLGIFLTNNTLVAGVANFLRVISGVPFFFFAGKYFRTKEDINKLMWGIIMVLGIPLFISLLEYFKILPYQYFLTWGIGRVTGGYKHPSNLFQYFNFSIPFTLFLLWQSKTPQSKLLFFFNLLITSFVGFFTYLRMGYFIIAAQLLAWYSSRHRKIISIAIVWLFVLLIFLKPDFFWYLFSTLFDIFKGTKKPIFYSAFSNRIGIWTVFLSDFWEAPIFNQLFGQGLNHVVNMNNLNLLLSKSPVISMPSFTPLNETHSDFIRVLTENGYIGFLTYLCLLFTIWRNTKNLIKKSEDLYFKNLGLVFILIFWGLILFSLTISPTITPAFMWYFYCFTSIIVYQSKSIKNDL
jgi:hypothetical protein